MPLEVPELGYRATVAASIRRAADLWGARDFIVMPDRRMTFAEAEEASRRLARRLLAAGVGKGTRVGIYDTYSTEWVVAWLAVMRIGALAMPFSSIYRPAELATVLRVGDVHTLLVPPSLLGRPVPDILEEVAPALAGSTSPLRLVQLPYLRQVWMWGPSDRIWATTISFDEGDDTVPDSLVEAAEDEVVPADWAQVTYTSGSSALPKGVLHSHGAIIRTTALSAQATTLAPVQAGPPVLFNAFTFFWIGGTLVLGRSLATGATLVCTERYDPRAALDMIERERCTGVVGWPSLVKGMKADPSFAGRDLSFCPSLAPDAPAAMPPGPVPGIPGHRSMSELVGNWNGSERRAVDPATGEPLLDMAEGELVVRGFGVMQGYYKKEREETFDADGWLHTADKVFLSENRPYYVGRFSEMVKSQGANVSPREVEGVLEAWPEIQHCFVFGLPHPVLEEEVVAVITFMPGPQLTAEEIKERARKELSAYKVPTRIEFARTSEIPWLGSGKPDKLRLRSRYR